MKAESIVYAIAGMCFGIILGWVIGTQQAGRQSAAVVQMQQAQPAPAPAADAQGTAPKQPPALDDAKVQGLMTILKNDPNNAGARVQLGNAYFDAERYPEAIKWYEQSVALNPRDVNVSTDLGVSYYYNQETDRAIDQLQKSLAIDPSHAKTLLNLGVVRAFGKRDLKGATEVWEKLVRVAPESPEGRQARQALDSLSSAHGNIGQ